LNNAGNIEKMSDPVRVGACVTMVKFTTLQGNDAYQSDAPLQKPPPRGGSLLVIARNHLPVGGGLAFFQNAEGV